MTREPVVSETLHRRLVLSRARQERGDDVAVAGVILGTHHHDVAVEDAGPDHRVSVDGEREVIAIVCEALGHGQVLLDVLIGEDRRPGGDAPDHRHRHRRRARLGEGHGSGLGRVLSQEALALEVRELRVHARRRREPDGLADLADRRRVPPLAHGLRDDLEDPLLA